MVGTWQLAAHHLIALGLMDVIGHPALLTRTHGNHGGKKGDVIVEQLITKCKGECREMIPSRDARNNE